MPVSDPHVQALPPALSSRYEAGRVLGSGGMSTVYQAHDPLLRRDVAVKVFRLWASDPDQLRLQETEARLIASLNHYALTTLFDAGVDTSDPEHPQVYLVMEYIPGADLRERLKEGALGPLQVCWLGLDLAEGLDYVHEAGFVHHDIKPANVLLADRQAETRIRGKLTDFGIASLAGDAGISESTTGTAAYLSPEQVEGGNATQQSDVYSLGLVLLEALTGRVAFPGGIEQSAFGRLDRDPDVPASVPAAIAEVLRAMTARRPADRPAPKEVAARLQAFLVDQAVAERVVDPGALATNEAERIAALRRYNILDTPADDAFDTVTRLAARLLRVPIALVTIVDIDRVWFKSRQGLELEQVDRNVAFCSTTNPEGDGPWSIPDALEDPRTRENPLVVQDPHVRSYAAAPLITRDGHHLGALCVFDVVARRFTADELRDLTDLASVVQRELELRLASRRAVFER